jgi:hypothetical protein
MILTHLNSAEITCCILLENYNKIFSFILISGTFFYLSVLVNLQNELQLNKELHFY